ncbi:hypothetical protein Tco_0334330, partial [Tanacetum coccineum]
AVVAVTPDLERKSDETEQVIIEEEKDTSDVKSGDTEELDLERIQSTARQSVVTPRTEKIDKLRNYLRIVDFEKSAQDRESLEAISMITEFKVIDSPDGEYLIIYRANDHFRAFNTL